MKEITVDYELLQRQQNRLGMIEPIPDELLDGLFELLGQIIENRPFREVKDR